MQTQRLSQLEPELMNSSISSATANDTKVEIVQRLSLLTKSLLNDVLLAILLPFNMLIAA